jgi:hypothetical protein
MGGRTVARKISVMNSRRFTRARPGQKNSLDRVLKAPRTLHERAEPLILSHRHKIRLLTLKTRT